MSDRDRLLDRVQAALDAGGGLGVDKALERDLDADPAAGAEARELARIDGAVRGLGAIRRSTAARQAFVSRVLRAVQAPAAGDEDPGSWIAPPALDDPAEPADAALPPVPPAPATAGSEPVPRAGEFSLERLGQLSTTPSEQPRPQRRPAPRPADDRVSIPKVARVLPPPPDLTLEPPTPAPAASLPPRDDASRFAIPALVAFLVVAGGAGAWWWMAAGDGDAEVARVDGPAGDEGPGGDGEGSPVAEQPDGDGAGDEAASAAVADAGAPEAADVGAGAGDEAETATAPAEAASRERTAARTTSRSSSRTRTAERAGPTGSTAETPRRSSASLPATPGRDDVLAAMKSVEPAVSACRQERSGIAQVRITVASSGRVRNAIVQGLFAGTPEGSCIARAVRRARFPEFREDSFTITYPFRL